MSGDFVADGACASEETTITAGPRCVIAPGPMGAAHQLGSSAGYDADCEGTPAEGSPYMWPPRWAAETPLVAAAHARPPAYAKPLPYPAADAADDHDHDDGEMFFSSGNYGDHIFG